MKPGFADTLPDRQFFTINETLGRIGELTGMGLSRTEFIEAVLDRMLDMGFDRARFWEVAWDVSRDAEVVVLVARRPADVNGAEPGYLVSLSESDVASSGGGLFPVVGEHGSNAHRTQLETDLVLHGRRRVEIPVTAGTRTESILACDWNDTRVLTEADLRALRLVGSQIGSHLALGPAKTMRRSVDEKLAKLEKPALPPRELIASAAKELGAQLDAAVTAVFAFSWPHQRLTKVHEYVAAPYAGEADERGMLPESYVASGPLLTGTTWRTEALRHIVSFEHLVRHKESLVADESLRWHEAVLGEVRSILYAVVGSLERRYLVRFTNRSSKPELPFVREATELEFVMRDLRADFDAAISLQRLNSLQRISGLTAASADPAAIVDTIGTALRAEGVEDFIALCHQRESPQFSFAQAYGASCRTLTFDLHERWREDELYSAALGDTLSVAAVGEHAAAGRSPVAALLAPQFKAVLAQPMAAGETEGVFMIPLKALPARVKGGPRELPADLGYGTTALVHAYSRLLANSVEMHHSQERAIGARRAFGLMGHEVRRPAAAVGSAGRSAIVASLQAIESISSEEKRATLNAQLRSLHQDLRAAERRLGSALRLAKLVARESEGTLKLRFAPADLSNVVKLARDDVDALVREESFGWNHFVSLNEAARELGTVVCDEDYIVEVLKNILLNAIKYSLPRQPGRRRSVKVDILGQRQASWVGVQVRNWGWPIPAENRDVIFEPWVRGYVESETEALAGMGLGLFLARRLVAAHSGEIVCTSVPTEHRFFPRREDTATAVPGLSTPRPEPVVIHETVFEVRIPRDLKSGVHTHVWGRAGGLNDEARRSVA